MFKRKNRRSRAETSNPVSRPQETTKQSFNSFESSRKVKSRASGRAADIFFTMILIIGIAVMAYPAVSNLWNSHTESRAISNYDHVLKDTSPEEKEKMWSEAIAYNESLTNTNARFDQSSSETAEYNKLLNIGGTGIMGYLKIPKLNIELPIYHGANEGTLRKGIGHVQGSSLPTGGPGTHAALSAHTGLPSAKLFSNLDRMKKGDIFIVKSVDHTMTYKVDQIKIVKPDNVKALDIVPGKDYCTLITCTPYGVNDHRLLVRGHRTANIEPEPNINPVDPVSIAMLIISGMLLILLVRKEIRKRKKAKYNVIV